MEKTLQIEGMMCQHCVMHIQKALAAVPGVEEVSANLESNSAKLKLSRSVEDEVFRAAIENAGYQLTDIK